MTDTRHATDDGSTAGKTTHIIQTLAQTDADLSESDAHAMIDPKAGQWGALTEEIISSFGQAMLEAEADYSLVDFRTILAEQQRREEFAASVEDPALRARCHGVAMLDDIDIQPVLRRIRQWAEHQHGDRDHHPTHRTTNEPAEEDYP
jgi:hypothetical protein